ncbi:N-acyl-D-amino-acid deacylase family protein [Aegicerativicinus sediminis]|uniref:N-acyl-D-amino-acid deacylase family protein n=1 Tax=Aegicerativicinus sediminis TaxID=2893202 RepID=UPI001E55ECE8|nr:D-aminoacylase [Aegicerativicinus sediminis]
MKRNFFTLSLGFLIVIFFSSCHSELPKYDIIIKNGSIVDGTNSPAFQGDIAIIADTIAAIGALDKFVADTIIDASGLTVSPGFINMLSWSTESLIEDGRSMSELKQGITLQVFGEGWSMGPLNDKMKEEIKKGQGDIKYDVEWTSLREYLEFLQNKGVTPNVASFVGATTLRIYTMGYENKAPSADEMNTMKKLVKEAMEDGALGVGSSLIYAPAFYSSTDELIELCKVVSEYDGMYISHMRSEGNNLLESLDELITIAKEANLPAEVYHLKMAGKANWNKFDAVVKKIDSARNAGIKITTDMYTYVAGATGLDASMPPWVQEGGYDEWANRLKDSAIRKKVIEEMKTESEDWENLMLGAGTADNMLLVGFKNDSLKYLTGKSLKEVAEMRGKSPEETAIDLVLEDGSRVGTVYFLMSEENVKKQIALPYMSFGSDAESSAPEGVFLKSSTHPRAYGNFARLLGKYVREEKIIPIEEAVHKLSLMPARNLKIQKRGALKVGYYADIVLFDAETITDQASFEDPMQYSTGVEHVFVNGVQVLKDGKHTGKFSGRVVYGPGFRSK